MPIMKPEVQRVLRAAGLKPENKEPKEDVTLEGQLGEFLSVEETLENLASMAKNSASDAIRLRALETALKLYGALKESTPQLPHFTIIINDGSVSEKSQVQVLAKTGNGVNPIFVPRQISLEDKDVN